PAFSRFLPLLFSLFRTPPTSTLLPYTTLFRSHHNNAAAHAHFHTVAIAGVLLHTYHTAHRRADRRHSRGRNIHPAVKIRPAVQGDRKSTRLNSSHVSISYAVFCLKKKTKQYNK